MFKEFKEFIMRGSVLDLAIGVIIGGAFGKIVSSLVNDVIMPPIGLLLGKVNFTDLYINLSGTDYPSLAAAQEAGAPTLNYGIFLNSILEFLIIALVIFLMIKQINRLFKAKEVPAEPATKTCPFCQSEIAIKATRCPHCTSEL
ncbi:MAG TPA: large-conductance mechanosensitive channel protein MscL [Anaerolineaceae bacterium]|nr:large-conductance mechanosensitive channel protein MscL [Anaerolineaceae bacterium]HQN04615.1 large-conductance mechanosensitive channel protein MscL [Anaerolineaceae bacterium]HQP07395.1 large-conductance mechanosensitive channel protein MscL [Anaerolineaceae bacterium]